MAYGYGEKLKKARETLGLKVEDVYRIIKIDPNYIKAMEEEQPNLFDREIYMKLFLKTYARFLKIDYKEILSLFEKSNAFEKEEISSKTKDMATNIIRAETKEEKTTVAKSAFEITILNPKNLIIFLGFFILLTVLIIVINFDKNKINKETKEENIYVANAPEQTIKVVAKAKDDSWIKCRYGDKEEDFILKKGQEKEWKDIDKIVFLVGNAAGVEFIVNGESIGTIGEEGEVINGLVFKAGKNWFIDRNQGFKRGNKPKLYTSNIPTPTVTPTIIHQQDTGVAPVLTKTNE